MEITKHIVELTPEDINGHIKAAIIDSAIGSALKDALQQHLRGWQFDQAVAKVVAQEIPKIIADIIREPANRERLAAAVRAELTDELVIKITHETVARLWKD